MGTTRTRRGYSAPCGQPCPVGPHGTRVGGRGSFLAPPGDEGAAREKPLARGRADSTQSTHVTRGSREPRPWRVPPVPTATLSRTGTARRAAFADRLVPDATVE